MVARIYSSANPSSGRFRNRSIYATGRGYCDCVIGGQFNGRVCGRGRGGRSEQGRGVQAQGCCVGYSGAHENGIDILDVPCYFEDSEWAVLSNYTKKRITEDPVRKNSMVNKKRRTTISVSAEKDNENWLISQIITGVQKGSQNEYGLAGRVAPFPTYIRSRNLCPAPIGRETGHSSCQSIFILACFLNPSDDLRD